MLVPLLTIGTTSAVAAVGLTAYLRGRAKWQTVKDDMDAAERRLLAAAPTTTQTFDPAQLADLPAPAQRWLRRAIAEGTEIPSSVEIEVEGAMQFGPQDRKRPLTASTVIVPSSGYLWRERVVPGPIPRSGILGFVDNIGTVEWSLLDTIRIVPERVKMDDERSDGNRSMAGRFTSVLVWTPWAFLPSDQVTWEAIDDRRARAQIAFAPETVPVEIEVDDEGRLVNVSIRRWGAKTRDRTFRYFGFRVDAHDEQTHGGFTIPGRVTSYWAHDDERPSPLMFHHEVKAVRFS
ncbi:MAG: DUF6544 family protein [Acidobacteriota bacterium]